MLLQVSHMIRQQLTERAASFGMLLDDISIVSALHLENFCTTMVVY